MPPNPCSALLPLTKPKKLEEAKAAADDAKVKNRQIFHLSLPICRRGFVICGDCGLNCGFCGFGGLWWRFGLQWWLVEQSERMRKL
ncbi:hypothetical protein CMV_029328 [Castanea mollissima]|uniref:Uncharacterized protein n=1 Tax=Castanea mollissima TaxID=60419 RepID=A0A8J4V7I2_9ROSI|nr:hypothetical protein CMV_029328 [Castanea mollissima]